MWDVCVPIAAVADMLAHIEQIASRHDILIANVAHIGDGNLHPLLIADPGDTAARDCAKIAFEEILSDALALGGHGDRRARRGSAQAQRSLSCALLAVLEMHRAVKAALDPYQILNPGKIFCLAG